MADCECLPRCAFFNDKMQNMPAAGLLQKRPCQGDNTNCARHMVLLAKERDKVPPDLTPNQVGRARECIASDG